MCFATKLKNTVVTDDFCRGELVEDLVHILPPDCTSCQKPQEYLSSARFCNSFLIYYRRNSPNHTRTFLRSTSGIKPGIFSMFDNDLPRLQSCLETKSENREAMLYWLLIIWYDILVRL